ARPLDTYGSGGDSIDPVHMRRELETVAALGLPVFKIRARSHQSDKAIWCQKAAGPGTRIAIDMTQNLAVPSQTRDDITGFLARIAAAGVALPAFLEEIQGPLDVAALPGLRRELGVPIAGGEIVTTPGELAERIRMGCYDIAQPDATVIGGVGAVLDIFAAARQSGTAVYVHCWGAGVGMLANYHAALAAGGEMVEWPLPKYALRDALFAEPMAVRNGKIVLSDRPGLGARLTPEIEAAYPFRPEATYRCLVDPTILPEISWR
ncbi:MAG TPA: enolase C-terminal domain-like protein, partial [Devosia sp.]|nr:enolase C-terminal domain-like protein [Devosia sp.]